MTARYRRVAQSDHEEEESKKVRAERIDIITSKIHALFWVLAAIGVVYFTDFLSLIHSDEINRGWIMGRHFTHHLPPGAWRNLRHLLVNPTRKVRVLAGLAVCPHKPTSRWFPILSAAGVYIRIRKRRTSSLAKGQSPTGCRFKRFEAQTDKSRHWRFRH